MRVVSIDPAPKKPAVVFQGTGKPEQVQAIDLPTYCERLVQEPDLLLCWDAPLTGPPIDEGGYPAAYSQRPIEAFFSRSANGFKSPPGISVLPYSGCPHWAITRATVGLPRLGRFDTALDQLPFTLCDEHTSLVGKGRWIVETHPAIAIWLWCRDAGTPMDAQEISWVYKGRSPGRTIEELWSVLRAVWVTNGNGAISETVNKAETPKTDDDLDAIVGWVLGTMFVQGSKAVAVVGDKSTGAILLPAVDSIVENFRNFRSSLKFKSTIEG
jgi:hypothetical protein